MESVFDVQFKCVTFNNITVTYTVPKDDDSRYPDRELMMNKLRFQSRIATMETLLKRTLMLQLAGVKQAPGETDTSFIERLRTLLSKCEEDESDEDVSDYEDMDTDEDSDEFVIEFE